MVKETAKSFLPCFMNGIVVHGFQRDSKKLGCPTANLSDKVVEKLDQHFPCGVYFGYASVDYGPIYRTVMSVGMNPHFQNTKKTIEAHLLHEFADDFYGSMLKIIVLGYIRDMASFKSIDDLKAAIKNDIEIANNELDLLEKSSQKDYRNDGFLKIITNNEDVIIAKEEISRNLNG